MLPRMAWFAVQGGGLPLPIRDQGIYTRAADGIASGSGLTFSRRVGWWKHALSDGSVVADAWASDPEYVFGLFPVDKPTAAIEPGYPVLLGLLFALVGPVSGAVFLLNCLFALIGVWAVRKMVGEFWGNRAGLTAAFIWALYPYYIYYSAYGMSDSLHISLLPLVVWFTLRAGERDRGGPAAGFATGFLFLIRSTTLFMLPLQLGYLVVKKRWRTGLWMLGAFALCCLPWVIRNQVDLGSPLLMPTKGSLNFWMRNNPDALAMEGIELPGWVEESISRRELLEYPSMEGLDTEIERSSILSSRAIEFMVSNPILIAYLAGIRFFLFLSPFGGTIGGTLPAIVGLAIYVPLLLMAVREMFYRRKDSRVRFMILLFLLYTALHTLAHGGVRYRLPVDMVLIVLSTLFAARKLGWEGSDQ